MSTISKKVIQEENEALKREEKRLADELSRTETERKQAAHEKTNADVKSDDLSKKLDAERESNELLEQKIALCDAAIEALKKELAGLNDVRGILTDLIAHVSKPDRALEEKAEVLIAENTRLRSENQRLTIENDNLYEGLDQLKYLEGKVDAYERTPMLNPSCVTSSYFGSAERGGY